MNETSMVAVEVLEPVQTDVNTESEETPNPLYEALSKNGIPKWTQYRLVRQFAVDMLLECIHRIQNTDISSEEQWYGTRNKLSWDFSEIDTILSVIQNQSIEETFKIITEHPESLPHSAPWEVSLYRQFTSCG